jgi:L-ribulose-5-phosphate 4-epimerase
MLNELKAEVFKANLDIVKSGLVIHTWGNVSGRDSESGLIVIKPSGVSYDSMKPEDMVVIDPEGNIVEGKYKPSTDVRTHLVLYDEYETIGGIVHTHSSYATAWAQSGKGIPAFGTTHADHYYGEIPCTRLLIDKEIDDNYEHYTGRVIIATLAKTDPLAMPAVLVNSHGPFCWGTNAANAVYNAIALEEIAKMAFFTVLLGKTEPIKTTLLAKHFNRKHGDDAYYGQVK